MIILAVSTSAKIPSAALLLADGTVIGMEDRTGQPHSVSLMPMIDELLAQPKLSLADVDCFAVDVGPGSFTGVRIGVSAVNAMAFAANKPIIPVCSLSALRHIASVEDEVVCCLLDARNGNGYAAVFNGDSCVLEPSACIQREVLDSLAEGARLVGDCLGGNDQSNAELVLAEAQFILETLPEQCAKKPAVPMYLRPSQAERMKKPE